MSNQRPGSLITTIAPADLFGVINKNVELRDWEFIIFHHTVNPDGVTTNNWATGEVIPETKELFGSDIDISHFRDRGFRNGMGYHILINPNGVVQVGNRWINQLAGAHALVTKKIMKLSRNDANAKGIGISFVGNFNKRKPTPEQFITAQQILFEIAGNTRITENDLYRHDQFDATSCPGRQFDIELFRTMMTTARYTGLDEIQKSVESLGLSFRKDALQEPLKTIDLYTAIHRIVNRKES